MALYFTGSNSNPDFLPTLEELRETCKKLLITREYIPLRNIPDDSTTWRMYLKACEYDDYGRNITEQQERQESVPWIKIVKKN